MAVLFGSLFFPDEVFNDIIHPILFLLTIGAAINLIFSDRISMWFLVVLFILSISLFGLDMLSKSGSSDTIIIRTIVHFIFSGTVTTSLIKQVWIARRVDKNVIMGLISGYISLGLVAFFLFLLIELINPGAFTGELMNNGSLEMRAESILYYAFITLLTIGYGEIVPVISVAQKAAILTGLAGQFYLIIVMTVVLEKYTRHSKNE
ncbi:MAG: ion channel [Bacteroidota bacterium]